MISGWILELGMSRRELVWTDSMVMGIILIIVGLAVSLGGVAGLLPSFLGAILLGVVLAGVGIALVRQGLRLRPHDTTHG